MRATVMNAAGTLNSGLFIRQQVLDMVYTSPHIWKIRETAELVGHMTQADEGAGTEELTQADEGAGMEEPMQPGEQIEAEDSAQPDEDNGSLSGDIPQADEFRILGINDLGSVYEDCEQDLTWADGWSWESFQKSRDVCVAGTAFLVGHGLEPGDHLSCSLEHYIRAEIGLGLEREELKPLEMEIVGAIEDSEAGESMAAEVMLPIGAVRQLYEIGRAHV